MYRSLICRKIALVKEKGHGFVGDSGVRICPAMFPLCLRIPPPARPGPRRKSEGAPHRFAADEMSPETWQRPFIHLDLHPSVCKTPADRHTGTIHLENPGIEEILGRANTGGLLPENDSRTVSEGGAAVRSMVLNLKTGYLILSICAFQPARAEKVFWDTISSGGVISSGSGSHLISSSVGQAGVGVLEGTSFRVYSGFWNPWLIGQVGTGF